MTAAAAPRAPAEEASPATHSRPRWRRPIAWLTIAWTGMLVSMMLTVPIYQAPDELTHVDRVRATSTASGFTEYDGLRVTPEVAASGPVMRMAIASEVSPFTVENAPVRPLPTFDELRSVSTDPGPINQLAGHPPAYYALMSGLRSIVTGLLPRDVWQFDREVLALRLMNVALMLPLPWLLASTGRALRLPADRVWVGAAFPLCVPQMAHVGSVVNNDNLLVLAMAAATMFGARILGEGLRWPTTLGAAVSAGVAVQTKLFGWAILPFLLVVCVLALRRTPQQWRMAGAGALLVALSTWPYLRNLMRYGHPYPTEFPDGALEPVPGFVFNPLYFAARFVGRIGWTFWGRFGWEWVRLPVVWAAVLSVVLVVCVVICVARPRFQHLRLMLLPAFVILAMCVTAALILHLESGRLLGQHGRYLFPAVASWAVAVAVAPNLRVMAWWPRAVALAAVVGYTLSLIVIIHGFWGGSWSQRFAAMAAWSPIGMIGPVIAGCAWLAAVVGVAIALRALEAANPEARRIPVGGRGGPS